MESPSLTGLTNPNKNHPGGTPYWTRTSDFLIRNQTFYPSELMRHINEGIAIGGINQLPPLRGGDGVSTKFIYPLGQDA